MLPGTVQLAFIAFASLFLWVPFALIGWALDRLDPTMRAWRALPPLERHRPLILGNWETPIPLPAH